MPKVEIESSWDRLGVELWPNYCFETPNLTLHPWGWLQWGVVALAPVGCSSIPGASPTGTPPHVARGGEGFTAAQVV